MTFYQVLRMLRGNLSRTERLSFNGFLVFVDGEEQEFAFFDTYSNAYEFWDDLEQTNPEMIMLAQLKNSKIYPIRFQVKF